MFFSSMHLLFMITFLNKLHLDLLQMSDFDRSKELYKSVFSCFHFLPLIR